jgi:hypothetical protein
VADKKWVSLAVVIVLVSAAFFVGNKYWFSRKYTVQVNPLPSYKPPSDRPQITLIKPYEETLEQIKQPATTVESGGAENNSSRNPFLWPGELNPPPPAKPIVKTEEVKPKKEVKPVEIPSLGMIIAGENNKLAVLDGTTVREGDYYAGHKVEHIYPKYVVLSGDYGVLRIGMQSSSYGEPKVDILEVKNPDLLIKPVLKDKNRQANKNRRTRGSRY